MQYSSRSTLYVSLIATGMGQTVVFAVLPLVGRDLGYSELQTNLLVSLAAFMYFLMGPFWGRLSDRAGRKPLILLGLMGLGATTLLFNVFGELGLRGLFTGWSLYACLMLSRGLMAGLMSATQPSSMAYMIDCTEVSERTRAMSRMAAAANIGVILGPSLTWFAQFSLLTPLYVHAAITFTAAAAVFFFLPHSPQVKTNQPTKKLSYFDPRIRSYLLVGFVMYCVLAVVQQTLAYYFQDTLSLTSEQTTKTHGVSMMVSSGVMLFAQLVIVQKWSLQPTTLLRWGLSATLISFVMMSQAETFAVLVASMAMFGLGMGLAGPGFTAGASLKVQPEEQGALSGLVAAAPGLGFVFGPAIGALLYQVDRTWPYYFSALVFVPLIFFVLKMVNHPNPE